MLLTGAEVLQEEKTETKVTHIIVSSLQGEGDGDGGCALRPVNGGLGKSWTLAPHLRLQSARLAFQTLSPVTRETLAALESTHRCHLHPRIRHPSARQTSHRPWKSCSERR